MSVMIPQTIKRRTPVRKHRKGGARRTAAWHSDAYRAYICTFPCLVCGDRPTDPCHTVNGGMRSKGPDSSCLPFCRVHHDQLDGRAKFAKGCIQTKAAFAAYYELDLADLAKTYYEAWKAEGGKG